MTQELLGRVHRELLDVLNSINQDKIHHDGDAFHELLNDVEKALAQPEQEPCVHAKNPKGCYRVRCQLGDKCVDDEMSFRTAPPQRTEQERNFCPRCGKRTNDIHTCTPPQENT